MQAANELNTKQYNDVIPHRHVVQTLRLDLKVEATDETDCIRQALPAALNYFNKNGTIVRWLITGASKKHVDIKAWLIQVASGNGYA